MSRMEDVIRAIQPEMDHHFGPDEMGPRGGRQELDDASLNGDGVVVGDGSFEAFAQDVSEFQIGRPGPPGGDRVGGWNAEAALKAGQEAGIEVSCGLPSGGDAVKIEFGHEAILKGAVDPFSPASGLGGVGKDEGNAQLFHGPLELGRLPIALGDPQPAVAGGGELGRPIKVKRGGQTILLKDLVADAETPFQVFLLLKEAVEGLAGGVVGAKDEGALQTGEPGMRRAIQEEHCALLGRTRSLLPMNVPFAAFAAQALGPQPKSQGFAIHPKALLFLEHLRQVTEVEVPISALGQVHDAFSDFLGKSPRRSPALVAMNNPIGPKLDHALLHPLHLAPRKMKGLGGLVNGHTPGQYRGNYPVPLDLFHAEPVFPFHAAPPLQGAFYDKSQGVTDLRCSQGVT